MPKFEYKTTESLEITVSHVGSYALIELTLSDDQIDFYIKRESVS